jgi:uncharacterized membrane protein YdjX (TVP38/TMEM64 family)
MKRETKQTVLKIIIIVSIIAAISAGIFFILRALGVTNRDELVEIVESTGVWGWLVFFLLEVVCTTLLCFIPGTSATFAIVGVAVFGEPWKAFLICSFGVFASSMCMFFIGRVFGEKVALKLVDEASLRKAQNLIDVKSKILLPVMFLFPVFPDDALCMAAGMTKMKYGYFAVITLLFRTAGIATLCFLAGGQIVDWRAFRLVDWFIVINLILFDVYVVYKLSQKLEGYIHKRNAAKRGGADGGENAGTSAALRDEAAGIDTPAALSGENTDAGDSDTVSGEKVARRNV